MNRNRSFAPLGRVLGTCAVLWLPAVALAAPPEVGVEIVEDEDDFFAPPAKKPAPPARPAPAATPEAGVRQRADALFDDLEREESKRGGISVRVQRDKDGDEVVDVTVGEAPPATPAAPEAPTPPPSTAPAPAAPMTSAPPPPPPQVTAAAPRSWWDRPSHVSEGDILFWVSGGSFDAGGFGGIGLEGMVTDSLGIRASGTFAGFGQTPLDSGFQRNFNFFEGGLWANERDVNPSTARGGRTHLMEMSLAWHPFHHSMLDVYGAAGMAHFGYDIDYRDGNEKGGAGYMRLGGGANLHISRFFAGVDFGWYPLEVFDYRLDRVGPDEYEPDFQPVGDRWNGERFTLTAQVGLRF